MKEKNISVPFAILSCVLSCVFSIGVFYASVENRLKNLEYSQQGYSDVRERVIRIETKMDYLIKTDKQQP
jgi:hypothetical protein